MKFFTLLLAGVSLTSATKCANIAAPQVSGATVVAITATQLTNYTVAANPTLGLSSPIPNINVCQVIVELTHPGVNDTETVQVWLPTNAKDWNGRFTAAGGSVWAAGLGDLSVAPLALQGFAAATSDAGLGLSPFTPAGWALSGLKGSVNQGLLTNFAYRSVFDVAAVGKAVTASYYGQPAKFTYWQGCSTGGRQALAAAERYPELFDGIVAGSSAVYWSEYVIAELWPQFVMQQAGHFPSPCELDAVSQKAVEACDSQDGVNDGVLNNPLKCHFDPACAIGSKVTCNGAQVTITKETADVVRKIWQGPTTSTNVPYWPGLTLGAPTGQIANSTVSATGTRKSNPFFLPQQWVQLFIAQNANFDETSYYKSPETFKQLFDKSKSMYSQVMDAANPDLSKLKAAKTKLLMWHGLSDQVIFPQDSIAYYESVDKTTPGNLDDFFRLFLAPGVDHCGVGTTPGAVPTDPFGQLRAWVENGTAPEYLNAATVATAPKQFTRKVCKYPLVAKYDGHGDQDLESSFACVSEH
jgi:pimeloyl-ACP methyl ester carboxylesterase